MRWIWTLSCYLSALVLGSNAAPLSSEDVAVDTDTGYFWQLTDIHYDANYSQHGLAWYLCHEQPWEDYYTRVDAIIHRDNATGLEIHGKYGDPVCDAPWELVTSAVQAMKRLAPDVDFILWTGDNMPHIPPTDFTPSKTFDQIQTLSDVVWETFQNTPIYPTLGNHDSWPANIVPPVEYDQYYTDALNNGSWHSMLDPDEQSLETFKRGGYYCTQSSHGLWVIGLNTLVWFTSNNVTANLIDPVSQFAWLETQLQKLRDKGEKVLLTGHVPPGYDISGVKKFYHPQHNQNFLKIVKQYPDVIVAIVVAHEHKDLLRMVSTDEGQPLFPLFTAPSLTPWRSDTPLGNNPAIRLYKYSRSTGQILDYTQYYLNLSMANSQEQDDWSEEYNLTETYGIENVLPESLKSVIGRLKEPDSELFRTVLLYLSVSSHLENCTQSCKRKAICGLVHLDYDLFDKCVGKHIQRSLDMNHLDPEEHEETGALYILAGFAAMTGFVAAVIAIAVVASLSCCRCQNQRDNSASESPGTLLLERS